jgi:G:T/U-mismatch repair DNA glycosylase
VSFLEEKMVFAKLIFFPPNFLSQKDFPFPKYQNKFWREKNLLSKKVF